ncbi:MAG: hypothetical protein COA47_13255 [Robiginitomaculum sp.]|nr:MAG: hypothetical protein COA47_13255 [Robiginitomaculum sp.]
MPGALPLSHYSGFYRVILVMSPDPSQLEITKLRHLACGITLLFSRTTRQTGRNRVLIDLSLGADGLPKQAVICRGVDNHTGCRT